MLANGRLAGRARKPTFQRPLTIADFDPRMCGDCSPQQFRAHIRGRCSSRSVRRRRRTASGDPAALGAFCQRGSAMRHEELAVVLALACIVSVLVTNGAAMESTRGSAVGPDPAAMSPRAPAFWATATTAAAQDPAAVEALLGLDRPTRRLIQQGLRNEGFDPGPPDGLFGPRTRAAIRGWQEGRGEPGTGYLDRVQAALLRGVGAPRQSLPAGIATLASQTAESPAAAPAQGSRQQRGCSGLRSDTARGRTG